MVHSHKVSFWCTFKMSIVSTVLLDFASLANKRRLKQMSLDWSWYMVRGEDWWERQAKGMITTVLAWWQMAVYCSGKRQFFYQLHQNTLRISQQPSLSSSLSAFSSFPCSPALINIQTEMQADSVWGNMTGRGPEIALISEIMLVRPSVNLTE